MADKYRRDTTSVTLIRYHFIWIVRRRKRVLRGELKTVLEGLIYDKALELDCEVLKLAIEPEHIHLFLAANPKLAPSQIMHRIKGASAHRLRKQFPQLMKLPSMWTRSYFCSTAGDVSAQTIERYIEAQGHGT